MIPDYGSVLIKSNISRLFNISANKKKNDFRYTFHKKEKSSALKQQQQQ